MSDPTRVLAGRVGAYRSWAKTPDRAARTREAPPNWPGDLEYHLRRLGPEFDDATERQRLDATTTLRSVVASGTIHHRRPIAGPVPSTD